MTLRQVLLETPSLPRVAVPSVPARATAERPPTRLDDRSYSARAALGRRHRIAEPPFGSRPPSHAPLDDGVPCSPFDGVGEETVGYRRLAIRIIQRAFKDMIEPACAAGDRESAWAFLAGSPMLLHWCSVAALDSRTVIVRATALRRRSPVRR